MTEQFDQIYDRRGYNCIKWSRNPYDHPDFIPMGIADMDIATPDFVIDGIRKRLDHPMLGYFRPDERFFQAILGWQKEQYGTADLSREDVAVQTSVLGAWRPPSGRSPSRATGCWFRPPDILTLPRS